MLKEYKLYATTWKEAAGQCRANDLPETAVILLNPVHKNLAVKFKAIYCDEGGSIDTSHLAEGGVRLKLLNTIDDNVTFINAPPCKEDNK